MKTSSYQHKLQRRDGLLHKIMDAATCIGDVKKVYEKQQNLSAMCKGVHREWSRSF
jgi:hypothetical protein